MVDVFPIKRRTSGKAVTKEDIVPYLQREVATELKAIRALLDSMLSASLESIGSIGNGMGVMTAGIQSSFSFLTASSPLPTIRMTFDPSQYPETNMSKVRRIDIDYWLDSSSAGGSPQVALFNADTNVEVSGTRADHTTGLSSSRSTVTDIPVGSEADEMPDEETVFYLKARDQDSIAIVTVIQAVLFVRYVDPDV